MKKIYFLVALATLVMGLNAQEWSSVYSDDEHAAFYSLQFIDADNGYVIGGSGTMASVLKTTDGGTSWTNKNTGLDGTLPQMLAFQDMNSGFVATTTGLYQTNNGGDTWNEVIPEADYDVMGVTYAGFYNNKHVYYAYGKDKMFKTTDFGLTWTIHYSSSSWMLINAILNPGQALEFYNENEFCFIYGSDFELYKFDGTEAYSVYGFEKSGSFACLSMATDYLVFASSGSRLVKIEKPGNDNQLTNNLTNALYIKGMDFISPDLGYGVSNDGKIYRYDGSTFNNKEYEGSSQLNAICCVNASTQYAIGNNGTILKKQGVNTTPQITSEAVTEASVGIEYTYTITATDADGDALTWYSETLPSWITLTDNQNGTCTLTGTPESDHLGANNVGVYVTDGIDEYWQMFQIIVSEQSVNNAPEITSTAVTEATAGQEFSYTVTATDEDGDVLSWVGETLPNWLTLYDNNDGTATLSGIPTITDIGNNEVVIKVTDGKDAATHSFTVNVQNSTSIQNIEKLVNVTPNPSNGKFLIKGNNLKTSQINLYNLYGELILDNINLNSSITLYESGVYILKIESENKTQSMKIIVN